METFKDTFEKILYIKEKIITVLAWASVSFARRVFALFILGLVLLIAQYMYLSILLTKTKESVRNQAHEIVLLEKELRYKATLDSITLCADSTKKHRLHDWYCKDAVIKYKQASVDWPQDRVKIVVSKLAYGAMKSDVSRYIRSVELDRRLQEPISKEAELLKHLLSKITMGLWIFAIVALMSGVIFMPWGSLNRKTSVPKV